MPVACVNSLLHLQLAVLHTALDTVHLAGSVTDDQGRTVVGLSLGESLQELVHVSAHSHLSHVDVAIAHGDLSQRLLGDLLTGSGELSHLADVGSLGCLAAGVGVDLGVEDEDVDTTPAGNSITPVTSVVLK